MRNFKAKTVLSDNKTVDCDFLSKTKYGADFDITQGLNSRVCPILQTLKEIQQESVKAANANIIRNEFLANISHEIRNPAGVIIGVTSILATCEPLTEKQRKLIHALQLSADSLVALLNDFLDITKLGDHKMGIEKIPFNLYQIMQDVIEMLSEKAMNQGLTISLKYELEKNKIFLGDPVRLRQMMLNLCDNAIKFTEKGNIEITVDKESSLFSGTEQIAISIQDEGIGMSPEQQKRVFQPFLQADSTTHRKYGGTGLGLIITKELAEAMGGSISVESCLGKGSIFILHLPLQIENQNSFILTQGPCLSNCASLP